MKKEMQWASAVLAAFISVPATASLIQRIFEIGLVSILSRLLEFYRSLFHPLLKPIYEVLEAVASGFGYTLMVPDPVRDVHILSFVAVTVLARSVYTARMEAGFVPPKTLQAKAMLYAPEVALVLLAGATFLGLFALLLIIPIMFDRSLSPFSETTKRSNSAQTLHRCAWSSTAALAIFFSANFLMKHLGLK